jgi:hypothetical protein
MFLFNRKTPLFHCGAIIDVGSGSVGIALVVKNNETHQSQIIWSHREYMLIKDTASERELQKEMNTTIINALLELGSNGVKALHQTHPSLKVEYIQTAISAPWSYTVTKTVNYEQSKEFEVTHELLKEMVKTAKKQVVTENVQKKVTDELGLRIITDASVQTLLNGYLVKDPIGSYCTSVSFSLISALANEKLLTTLEDSLQRIFPKVAVEHYSFIFLFYIVLEHLHPNTAEIYLVDITNEATEIGVVRDNVLHHTTHIPTGMFTLARAIASKTKLPKEEAFALLKEGYADTIKMYTKRQREQIEEIRTGYINELTQLFNETGDALTIPNTIFLHTAKNTEDFFLKCFKEATKNLAKSEHKIHLFTSELLEKRTMEDSALALSIHYFQMKDTYSNLVL